MKTEGKGQVFLQCSAKGLAKPWVFPGQGEAGIPFPQRIWQAVLPAHLCSAVPTSLIVLFLSSNSKGHKLHPTTKLKIQRLDGNTEGKEFQKLCELSPGCVHKDKKTQKS